MSKSPSRKKYGFSYDSIQNYFVDFVDLQFGHGFCWNFQNLLQSEFQSENLVQSFCCQFCNGSLNGR